MKTLLKWVNQNGYGATSEALANAEKILTNRFIFNHPYAMEAYNQEVFLEVIDWLYTPNDDEEWTFMLNRQEYLLDLLIAFQVTDNQEYLIKAKTLLLDWIEGCQDQESNAWRTIDTGIRLMYWALILRELKATLQTINRVELEQIESAIRQQVTYLDDRYITKYDLSNWGVLITSGIIVMGNLHPTLVDRECLVRNSERLTRQVRLQVQSSGLHWEQSPLYLMEVWRHVMMVWLSLEDAREQPEIGEAIQRMLKASLHMVKPNGIIVQQGDTDAIRITDMIQTTSLLLGQGIPQLFCGPLEIDLLLLQLIDQSKVKIMDWPLKLMVSVNLAAPTSLIDHQTGNYFYRDSWQKQASFLHLFNGPLGSGHGHASLGHVDFVYRGMEVLIDPGRYTYREVPERLQLKGVQSHNVLTINQTPFCVPSDSWGYEKATTALGGLVAENESSFVTQVTYNDLQGESVIRVTRTYLWLKEGLLIIFDYCQGSSLKQVEQRLTFHPEWTVSLSEEGVVLAGPTSDLVLWSSYEERQLDTTWYSPTYNELGETKQLLATQMVSTESLMSYTVIGERNCRVKQLTVIQSGTESSVPNEKCFALAIESEGQRYVIAIQSEDTYRGHKLYYVDGQPVYGKLVVIRENNYQRLL